MSTRSRRSRGAGETGINPAMIQLYDVGRLRKELEQRGLDTKGNKQVLADRLQEAVVTPSHLGFNVVETASPATPKLGAKRKAEEAKKSPVKKTPARNKKAPPPSPPAEEELEEPDDEVEEDEEEEEKEPSPEPPPAKKRLTRRSLAAAKDAEMLETTPKAKPAPKTKKTTPKKAASSVDVRSKKKSNVAVKASKSADDVTEVEVEQDAEKLSIPQEESASEPLSAVASEESEKPATSTVEETQVSEKSEPSSSVKTNEESVVVEENVPKEKSKSVSREPTISKDSKLDETIDKNNEKIDETTKRRQSIQPVPPATLKQKPNASKTPVSSNLKSGKPVQTIERRISVSKPQNNIKPSTPATLKPSVKSTIANKPVRKLIVKKPAVSASSLDLLDSIISGQTALLDEKYKSEQDRSEERAQMEFERRSKNDHAFKLPPMEKKTSLSTDSASPLHSPAVPIVRPVVPFDTTFSSPQPSASSDSPQIQDPHQLTCEERLHSLFSPLVVKSKSVTSTVAVKGPPPPPPPGPPPSNAKRVGVPPPPPPAGPPPSNARKVILPPPPPPSGPPPSAAKRISTVVPPPPLGPPPTDAKRISIPPPPPPGPPPANTKHVSVPPPSGPPPLNVRRISIPLPPENTDDTSFGTPVQERISIKLAPRSRPTRFSANKMESMPPPKAIMLPIKVPVAPTAPVITIDTSVPPPMFTLSLGEAPMDIDSDEEESAQPVATSSTSNAPASSKNTENVSEDRVDDDSEEIGGVASPVENPYAADDNDELDNGNDVYDPLEASMTIRDRKSLLNGKPQGTQDTDDESDACSSEEDEAEDGFEDSSDSDDEPELIEQPRPIEPVKPIATASLLTAQTSSETTILSNTVTDVSVVEVLENTPTAVKEDVTEPAVPQSFNALLQNPSLLLQKASAVLKNLEESRPQIQQEELEGEYEIIEEEKPLPDFHGEPVPDSDDDDALFEMAAGLPKKKKEPKPIEDEPLADENFVELDYFNSDLNMKASPTNKWLIDPDNADGFALMWGGVRSNYGIMISTEETFEPIRVAFQIKITEFLTLKHVPFEELDPHDVRVGWSVSQASNLLGEDRKSYGFNSMERKAAEGVFRSFGDSFHLDDVITTVLELESSRQAITYYKNGELLGVAYEQQLFDRGDIVYPHIATKNCKVLVNFGTELSDDKPDDWNLPADVVEKGVKFVGKIDRSLMKPSFRPPADKADCTVILMVGLPGVGKTTWVRQYLKEHDHERWVHLHTDAILTAMRVNGVPRKRVTNGRWDMILGLAAKAMNRSLQMACRRRHNYFIDQSNCSRDARKRRLSMFEGFRRRAVVLVPTENIAEERRNRRNDPAGEIPVEALLELKATMSLPCPELEPLDNVTYVEPTLDRIREAIDLVERYNTEGQPWIRKHKKYRPHSVISDHRGHQGGPWVGDNTGRKRF